MALVGTAVTFLAGSMDPMCVNVVINDDILLEDDETFSVRLSTEDSGVMLGNAVMEVTILASDGECGVWWGSELCPSWAVCVSSGGIRSPARLGRVRYC